MKAGSQYLLVVNWLSSRLGAEVGRECACRGHLTYSRDARVAWRSSPVSAMGDQGAEVGPSASAGLRALHAHLLFTMSPQFSARPSGPSTPCLVLQARVPFGLGLELTNLFVSSVSPMV